MNWYCSSNCRQPALHSDLWSRCFGGMSTETRGIARLSLALSPLFSLTDYVGATGALQARGFPVAFNSMAASSGGQWFSWLLRPMHKDDLRIPLWCPCPSTQAWHLRRRSIGSSRSHSMGGRRKTGAIGSVLLVTAIDRLTFRTQRG